MPKSKKTNSPTLDLHGFKKDEVFDAVDKFLMRANNKNLDQVRIMPGKGKGIVLSEVMSYLKHAGYHWKFEKQENGKTNEGVMLVFL